MEKVAWSAPSANIDVMENMDKNEKLHGYENYAQTLACEH